MFRLAVATGLLLIAPATGAEPARPPSFLNDVIPILTRHGCNQGTCHGKGAGQNGFRLSLRGYAPEQDHHALTRECEGRRADPVQPERSLVLLKATGKVSHEGGKVLRDDGPEYRTLLRWVAAGAPGPNRSDPRLARLEILPSGGVLKVGQSVTLSARAMFSDGSRRDVTRLTRFESNDGAVIEATGSGRVTALRAGATAVRAAFQSEVAVASFSVPHARTVDETRYAERNNFIDDHVFARLRDLRIEPSDRSSDAEFLRRVHLDLCGILPAADEVRRFLADSDPRKREKLIDSLLTRPEFTDYWTLFLGDLLQNRKERDHDVRGAKGVRQFHTWLRKQVAVNRPWDAIARDVLTATGLTASNPAVGYYVVTVGEHREAEKSEVAESVAQAFLGTRIGCARCHNHPLERYTQDDFYHFSAFFTRVKLERKDPRQGPTSLVVSHLDPGQNKSPVGVRQPRTGEFLKPQPLDRTPLDVAPGSDPRQALAAWITSPANDSFSGAMVNRIWRHFFSVGLVEPVDDLRATNPPSNPALFTALRQDFVNSRFDLRRLIRVIVSSRAYQLTSATRAGNHTDTQFYSHYYPRRLPAEVLLDAVCRATGTLDRFDGHPHGVRAVQVGDPGAQSAFLRTFGRSERVTACACERTGDVTLPQVLVMQNSLDVTGKIFNGESALPRLLELLKDDGKLTEELFLRTLSRLPTAAEQAAVRAELARDARGQVYSDLMWALLNAKDFTFNH